MSEWPARATAHAACNDHRPRSAIPTRAPTWSTLRQTRYAIGARQNLLEHLRRQPPALGHFTDDFGTLSPPQAGEGETRHAGLPCSRWRVLRPARRHQKDRELLRS